MNIVRTDQCPLDGAADLLLMAKAKTHSTAAFAFIARCSDLHLQLHHVKMALENFAVNVFTIFYMTFERFF